MVPPPPRLPPPKPRSPIKGRRIVAGAAIALGGHLLTVLLGLAGWGVAGTDELDVTIMVGLLSQLVLFLVCLIAGIVLAVRQDGGIGIGLLIGWAVGVLVVPVVGIGVCVAILTSLSTAG